MFVVCLGLLIVENVTEMVMLERHLIQSTELEMSHDGYLTAPGVQGYTLQFHKPPTKKVAH